MHGEDRTGTLALAAAYAALTGVRTTAAPFALSRRPPGTDAVVRALRSPVGRGLVTASLAAELVVDKMPWIPPRTDAVPLAGRIAVGVMVGAVIADGGGASRLAAAAIGGAAAAGSAFIATRLRRRLTRALVPDIVVGLAEDAVVLLGAWALSGVETR